MVHECKLSPLTFYATHGDICRLGKDQILWGFFCVETTDVCKTFYKEHKLEERGYWTSFGASEPRIHGSLFLLLSLSAWALPCIFHLRRTCLLMELFSVSLVLDVPPFLHLCLSWGFLPCVAITPKHLFLNIITLCDNCLFTCPLDCTFLHD